MSGYRQLHTRMWSSDRWFAELKPGLKLLFIYLFSNERASVCGLYEIPLRVISFETGLDKETITSGFQVFKDANKVLYDYDSGVVYVKNMFKYQGSQSPKLLPRIKADLKAVPECALKEQWLQENRTLIPYRYSMDTSISISESDSLSGLESEGGGAGEGDWIPETPKQAAEHPDIQAFEKICNRFPGVRDYGLVIETIKFLRAKHGAQLIEMIKPFWLAWSTRKTQGGKGKPYDQASLVWLTEWAVNGEIPRVNGMEPKSNQTSNQDIIKKVAQNAHRSTH